MINHSLVCASTRTTGKRTHRIMILNADIVTPGGLLHEQALLIENDRIGKILPMRDRPRHPSADGAGIVIDAQGLLVCPGFIDLHSDHIENLVQPRPTSVMDFELALMEQEKSLVNHGITTMFHSLSFIGENGTLRDKEARKPDRMRELAALIKDRGQRPRLVRHRFHCRFDVRNTAGYETLMSYLKGGYINLLSFIDHTPGQGQYRDLLRYRQTMHGYKPGLDESDMDRWIGEKMAAPRVSAEMIEAAAAYAKRNDVVIASHDDDSYEKIEYVRERLKADISEFPVELRFARHARSLGLLTVAGAPNILLGQSHSGNMSALEAVREGVVDILCSDYYPAALLHAVFKLNSEHGFSLCDSVNLISLHPARALGIDGDFGSVEAGKKADLVLVAVHGGRPAVVKVFVDGVPVSSLEYRFPK
jgi:alpha-D-ribose 1-methylphosphonate 5-triphosphate diphosphatase